MVVFVTWRVTRAFVKSLGSASSDWKLKKARWPPYAVMMFRAAEVADSSGGWRIAWAVGSGAWMPIAITVIRTAMKIDREAGLS
jgi:hypothetical protein